VRGEEGGRMRIARSHLRQAHCGRYARIPTICLRDTKEERGAPHRLGGCSLSHLASPSHRRSVYQILSRHYASMGFAGNPLSFQRPTPHLYHQMSDLPS
jgi:hypothetical protein